MASLRTGTKLFRTLQGFQSGSRGFHTGKRSGVLLKPLLAGTVTAAAGLGAFTAYKKGVLSLPQQTVVHAKASPEAQPSVYSQGKENALYLWIHLKPEADVKACARSVAGIQKMVDEVTPADLRDESDEIWAGVGFGPNFYQQVGGKVRKNYNYPHRKGSLGDMPSSGGDIFVHAKCNTKSKLFELAQKVVSSLPSGSIDKFEDTYSFVYKNGRDLSGFIDGTENAADDDDRREIAVEKETGGSYVITQVWVHKLDVINSEKDATMEKWVGRTRNDSTELKRKPITSHVARMTGGNGFEQKKPFQIVRQSMPYGSLSEGAGLFFIGYAASPENFEFMLSNMVGGGIDSHSDDVMRLTACTKGTYWYFPGKSELQKFA